MSKRINVPLEMVENKIYFIRGERIMLSNDLAKLYGVTTSNLNKAVKRNIRRFPGDFMFQLTKGEYDFLRFQFGILKRGTHSKYLPYAFTEQGIAMLSGVLNSNLAIDVNIAIMRAFIKLRNIISTNNELKQKLKELEERVGKHDVAVDSIFRVIERLLLEPEKPKKKIGFLV